MSIWHALFDGTESTAVRWNFVGKGRFAYEDGALVTYPSDDLGLFYWPEDRFDDFHLQLAFRLERHDDNSGVHVRFREPTKPVPTRGDPHRRYPYDNQAWVAVHTGFEVQIDDRGIGGKLEHFTGAIYDVPVGHQRGTQRFRKPPPLALGRWNELDVIVRGDVYDVRLNGVTTTIFENADEYRGKPASRDPDSGYVGIQTHTGHVSFRDIRIRRL